ncbi:hypothetical protein NDU88_005941 [Pleurodeles waltl]|uniref:Uncharacterized protein n=1 Tax=Pleurodeles waltl TaxID=8319 RepID=A0AAV7L2C0_PLEWA|nr:hypothetical protein NDU88_005941 [Pleurodeles waltl]
MKTNVNGVPLKRHHVRYRRESGVSRRGEAPACTTQAGLGQSRLLSRCNGSDPDLSRQIPEQVRKLISRVICGTTGPGIPEQLRELISRVICGTPGPWIPEQVRELISRVICGTSGPGISEQLRELISRVICGTPGPGSPKELRELSHV